MARLFNGTSDVITCPVVLTATISYSFSCWVYPTDLTGDRAIFANGTAGTDGCVMYATASGNVGKITYTTGAGVTINTALALTLNAWSQVIFRMDPFHNVFIWINGTQTFIGSSVSLVTPTGNTFIGANSAAATQPFKGRIADFAGWNIDFAVAASADGDWTALSKWGARPNKIRPSALQAWLPLDGLQSPEPDLSGFKKNGTLTGTALAPGPPYMQFTPRQPQWLVPPAPVLTLMPQILM